MSCEKFVNLLPFTCEPVFKLSVCSHGDGRGVGGGRGEVGWGLLPSSARLVEQLLTLGRGTGLPI